MNEDPGPTGGSGPDADLIEYLLVGVPSPRELDTLVSTVVELVRTGAIRLIDVVLLERPSDDASVHTLELHDVAELAVLADLAEDRVLLSEHDLELLAVALEPAAVALLLLVEDRWAARLSNAARMAGGRLLGGERVVRDRFLAAADSGARIAEPSPRDLRDDLLGRSPQSPDPREQVLAVDQADQLHELADLLERGVLSLEQYDAQRRRVLGG